MANENKEDVKEAAVGKDDGENIRKCFKDIGFAKVEDKFTVTIMNRKLYH